MSSETDSLIRRVYMAGVIDGEGSIFITKSRGFNVRISNTDKKFLEEIQEIAKKEDIEISLYKSGNNPNRKPWKVGWQLQINKKDLILSFLKKVIEFLICRKSQAIIMIDILEKKIEYEDGFDILKRLNKKGLKYEEEEFYLN